MTTIATLFSGGEGVGVGAKAAGLDHLWGIEYDDAIASVARANGSRRTRTIKGQSIARFLTALAENFDTARTIRVYSSEGFVANSYKYRADITFIEAARTENGFNVYAGTGDAKRSHGAGSTMTINGRAI